MIAKRFGNRILLYSAMGLLACLVFVPAVRGQAPAVPAYSQPTLPGKGVAGPVTTVPHSFADQAFVKSMMERDVADVQLGELAKQKSQSDDVKQLGQRIADDRTVLNDRFKAIAKTMDVSEPKGPSKKDKQLMAKLAGLSGSQFDEEYLKAVVKIHRQDVKDFQVESEAAEDPNLKQTAQQEASVISQHLQAIEQIAQAHNVAIGTTK
jgi:putative membrane protein